MVEFNHQGENNQVKKNKENIKEVVNNAREVYEIKNYIISVFEGSEKSIEAKGKER